MLEEHQQIHSKVVSASLKQHFLLVQPVFYYKHPHVSAELQIKVFMAATVNQFVT